jgi:predicted ATP-dependent protease
MKSKNYPSDDSLPEQPADNLIAAIDAAIKSITKMLTARAENDEELDWSLSDLLKLLQVRREIVAEQPKEVYAYWVDDPKDRIAALRAKEQEEEQQGPRRVA